MLDLVVTYRACQCTVCGVPFTNRRSDAQYCSPLCASRAFNAKRKADGRLVAQRIQLAEYNKQYLTQYRQKSLRLVPCAACGVPVQRSHLHRDGRRPACSGWCMGYLRNGKWPSTPIPDRHPVRSTRIPRDHPSRARPKRTRFSAGQCVWCGKWFIADRMACDNHTSRHCSPTCARSSGVARHNARKRDAYIADVPAHYIYQRDNWTCQLCHRKVDRRKTAPHPKSPSLDHIIPLARGGTHEPANVHTAHFLCNSLKSDRGGGEQFLLFG